MHVTLVSGFDLSVPSAGGTRSYVEALREYLSSKGIAHLLVSAGRRTERFDWSYRIRVPRPGSSVHFLCALAVAGGSIPMPQSSIVHIQRPDDALPFALRKPNTIVCTLHGSPFRALPMRRGAVATQAYRAAEAMALRLVNRVLAVDSKTASEYLTRYPWLEGRISIVPNAVDTRTFRPLDRAKEGVSWPFSGVALLYAGRLEPDKHVRDILRTFLEVHDYRMTLVVAGDGSERPFLERAAAGHSVVFVGRVARERMPSLLNAVDAVVLFSDEGLSSVALEAIACGVPVITTPTGDMPRLVQEGRSGFLVSNLSELGEAMTRIGRGDLPPSPSIAAFAEPYAWAQIGAQIFRVYSEVAKHHGS